MGIVTAALGIVSLIVYILVDDARIDGLGAIFIASTVILLAFDLIIEIKDLLVGRSAMPEVEADIRNAAKKIEGVNKIPHLRTLYMGTDRLMIDMVIVMDPDLTTNTLEQIMDQIKIQVKHDVPSAHHILIEFETSIDQ
jgi:divalent metal cation (Fe/Co/Zn/Cd) transporter